MEEFPIIEYEPTKLFPNLKEIPDCPKQLFVRGDVSMISGRKMVVVVGSRNCTSYGIQVCKDLICELRNQPVVIVSGLALGIDSVAHRAALENNIPTIAFPGSGLDKKVLYPARHLALAENILKSGGALISEYQKDTQGAPWTFPRRNRLLAGIADIIITIEAEEKSGTLITSRLGTEYNKTVGAVPGNINSPNSKGTNWLLTLGAVPILSVDDIIRELNLTQVKKEKSLVILTPDEERLIELLTEPQSRDALSEGLGIDIVTLNRILSALEIKGCITENYGLIEYVE